MKDNQVIFQQYIITSISIEYRVYSCFREFYPDYRRKFRFRALRAAHGQPSSSNKGKITNNSGNTL